MAASLSQQFTNATGDATFAQKVEMAAVSAAINIAAEGSAVTNHTNRSALAKLVTNNPSQYGQLFAIAVCTQPDAANTTQGGSVGSGSTDTVIANAVSAVWNTLAGGL